MKVSRTALIFYKNDKMDELCNVTTMTIAIMSITPTVTIVIVAVAAQWRHNSNTVCLMGYCLLKDLCR